MAWRSSLTKAVQELRIHLCTSSPASQGVREFVLTAYPEIKRANPLLPILVREAPGAEARLVARFARGAERSVSVQGAASAADVERALQELAAKGGG